MRKVQEQKKIYYQNQSLSCNFPNEEKPKIDAENQIKD